MLNKYMIIAEPPGVVLEYTELYSQAQKAWRETKCQATLYRVVGGKLVPLEHKKSLPMLTPEERMSYGKGKKETSIHHTR